MIAFAKRTLSVILSLAILMTGLVMGMTSVATGGVEVWNGTDVTKPSGAGSETDPVLITNGAELAYVIINGGGAGMYFKFANDIYLNDKDKMDWTTGTIKEGENYTPNEWFDSTKTTARFRKELIERMGEEKGKAVRYAEAHETCPYGGKLIDKIR